MYLSSKWAVPKWWFPTPSLQEGGAGRWFMNIQSFAHWSHTLEHTVYSWGSWAVKCLLREKEALFFCIVYFGACPGFRRDLSFKTLGMFQEQSGVLKMPCAQRGHTPIGSIGEVRAGRQEGSRMRSWLWAQSPGRWLSNRGHIINFSPQNA